MESRKPNIFQTIFSANDECFSQHDNFFGFKNCLASRQSTAVLAARQPRGISFELPGACAHLFLFVVVQPMAVIVSKPAQSRLANGFNSACFKPQRYSQYSHDLHNQCNFLFSLQNIQRFRGKLALSQIIHICLTLFLCRQTSIGF